MKRIALLLVVTAFGLAPALHAQAVVGDHVEVGVFGDYYRLSTTNTSFGGLGARIGGGARWLHFEGETAYDFDQFFTEDFTNPSTGAVTVARSGLRILRADIGPKFQIPGPIKAFVTVKGGIDDLMFDSAPATFASYTSSVSNLRLGNIDADLYAGGGFEGFLGPIGVRLDVGDDIFFTGHTRGNNNLRISFGPQFRF